MVSISEEEAMEHRKELDKERASYTKAIRSIQDKIKQTNPGVTQQRIELQANDNSVALEAMTEPELRQFAKKHNVYVKDNLKDTAKILTVIKDAMSGEVDKDTRLSDLQDDLTTMKRSELLATVQKENLDFSPYGNNEGIRAKIRAARQKKINDAEARQKKAEAMAMEQNAPIVIAQP